MKKKHAKLRKRLRTQLRAVEKLETTYERKAKAAGKKADQIKKRLTKAEQY